jgi:hypothetical protein
MTNTGNPERTIDCFICGGARYLGLTHSCGSSGLPRPSLVPRTSADDLLDWLLIENRWLRGDLERAKILLQGR